MEISLEQEQEQLLFDLVEAHYKLPREKRQDFKYSPAFIHKLGARPRIQWEEAINSGGSMSFDGRLIKTLEEIPHNLDHDIIFHPGFNESQFDTFQSDIDALELSELIKFRNQDKFFITPKGFEVCKKMQNQSDDANPLSVNTQNKMSNKANPETVFVVHGRNHSAKKALFSFLRSIHLKPLEWGQAIELTGKASPYVGEILEAGFSAAQAAIILFTPDDEAQLKESLRGEKEPIYETELTGQARPNVIFEAGMAMGIYPNRTVLVELGELRPISDITGRHVVRLNNTIQKRQELANKLKTAGCTVNLTGDDWHDEGNFELSIEKFSKKSEEKSNSLEKPPEEAAVKILSLLNDLSINSEGVPATFISEETRIPESKTQYLLDKLSDTDLITFYVDMDMGALYHISKNGRKFFFEGS